MSHANTISGVKMGRYLLRRVLVSIPVLIGITLLTFLFINLAPGDPVSMLIDPDMALRMPPEWFEVQRVKLGLDKPLMVRYFIWLGELFRGTWAIPSLAANQSGT